MERELAKAGDIKAQTLEGTQQVRLLAGHTQFGARVVHGDCLFLTLSPNEQKSALVLRLSRYRQNDPWQAGTNDVDKAIHSFCGRDAP